MNKFFSDVLTATFLALISVVIVADVNAADYIGANKCKACHIRQYKAWEKTSMSDSFEHLKAGSKEKEKKKAGLDPGKDYTADSGCLKCHTTGYGKSGGFTNIEETPNLTGVQCESCHGPGGQYVKIMKKNKKYRIEDVRASGLIIPSEDEKGCMECHGSDSPFTEEIDARYKWDFRDRLERTHKHFPLKFKH